MVVLAEKQPSVIFSAVPFHNHTLKVVLEVLLEVLEVVLVVLEVVLQVVLGVLGALKCQVNA